MPKQLYLLDTNNANKPIDSGFNASHSYNVNFTFKNSPLMYIKSISLKSVEMPYFLPNIRINNLSAGFPFTFSYSTFSNVKINLAINSGNYTSIATLISTINSSISASIVGYASLSIVLSQYTITQTGQIICRITTNATALSLDNTLLTNQILGFATTRSTVTTTLDGINPINLNVVDTCLFMSISNLPVVNNNLVQSSSLFTFKIPLNNSVNNVAYFNDTNDLQTIYLNNNSFILDKLDIRIYDRYGFYLYGYYDFTFTLLIEYDDNINNNQVQFLNINN